MEIQYKDFEGLIHKIVNKRKLNFDKEDILAQANLIFSECLYTYDPTKAKFSTYLYQEINFKLMNYTKQLNKVYQAETDYVDWGILDDAPSQFEELAFDQFKLNLSQDSKRIISIIKNPPESIDNINRYSLWKFLREKGWKCHRITDSFEEIKTGLSELYDEDRSY